MLPKTGTADIYTDFNGLPQLRKQAKAKPPEALKEAATQFEALILQETLKNTRSGSLGDGLMDSKQSQFYRDMYDQQLAIQMAKNSNLGLSNLLVKQLGGEAEVKGNELGKTLADYRRHVLPSFSGGLDAKIEDPPKTTKSMNPVASQTFNAAKDETAAVSGKKSAMGSRAAFVNALWPHAKAAAEELGVDPKLLLAQAALETGWGKSLLTYADGTHSHNLFGIKADKSWQGRRIVKSTLEYEAGTVVRRQAAFRSYDNFVDSFKDYVNFLKSNPRYANALAKADDPDAYIRSLQKAGYATDPKYAQKILSIARHERFANLA
jgi:flagellar protein FlgJ